MTFDPFGDFETRGYLRNIEGEKDLAIVRRLEHLSFTTGIEDAFRKLSQVKTLSYEDVLGTHKILFEAVYPWAGQDRSTTAPDLAVSKGPVLFAYPPDVRRSIEYALNKGQEKAFMSSEPGTVMGYLAYGHPFFWMATVEQSWSCILCSPCEPESASIGPRPVNPNISPLSQVN